MLLWAGGAPGCLYLDRIVRKTDNQAPTLVSPTEEEAMDVIPRVLRLEKRNLIQIRAIDRDGDDLVVYWQMNGGQDPQAYDPLRVAGLPGEITTFSIFPPRDPKLDGVLLEGWVVDSNLEGKLVRFRLEVP